MLTAMHAIVLFYRKLCPVMFCQHERLRFGMGAYDACQKQGLSGATRMYKLDWILKQNIPKQTTTPATINYYFLYLFIAFESRCVTWASWGKEENRTGTQESYNKLWTKEIETTQIRWHAYMRRSKSAHDGATKNSSSLNIVSATHIYIYKISCNEWFECMPQTDDDRCDSLIGSSLFTRDQPKNIIWTTKWKREEERNELTTVCGFVQIQIMKKEKSIRTHCVLRVWWTVSVDFAALSDTNDASV